MSAGVGAGMGGSFIPIQCGWGWRGVWSGGWGDMCACGAQWGWSGRVAAAVSGHATDLPAGVHTVLHTHLPT